MRGKIRKGQVIQKGKVKRLKMSMKVFEKEQLVKKKKKKIQVQQYVQVKEIQRNNFLKTLIYKSKSR